MRTRIEIYSQGPGKGGETEGETGEKVASGFIFVLRSEKEDTQ
jgi:hypothetical protein